MAESSDTDDGWFPLLSAVEAQDVDLVRSLLDDGADADRAVVAGTTAPEGVWDEDWIGTRPLGLAAIRGRTHIVEALLGRATLNLGNAVTGETAAFLSACYGNLDVLRLLVDKGADINKVGDVEEISPALTAAWNGHLDVLRLLVDNGADINKVDTREISPAYIAAQNDHLEVLRLLVDNRADINRAANNGRTPAFTAAQGNHHEALRILHRGKASLHEPDDSGWTPMHVAAVNGHLDIVYYLARHGADLTQLDVQGQSALDHARYCGRPTIATLLEAVQSAGGWRDYVARLRLPYCLIRHEVSRAGLVCPVNEDEKGERGLYHFVFGAGDEVVEQGPAALLRAAPDDVFAVIGSYLGVRLTDDVEVVED